MAHIMANTNHFYYKIIHCKQNSSKYRLNRVHCNCLASQRLDDSFISIIAFSAIHADSLDKYANPTFFSLTVILNLVPVRLLLTIEKKGKDKWLT